MATEMTEDCKGAEQAPVGTKVRLWETLQRAKRKNCRRQPGEGFQTSAKAKS